MVEAVHEVKGDVVSITQGRLVVAFLTGALPRNPQINIPRLGVLPGPVTLSPG